MKTKSHLLLPPKELSSCIAAAIYRDARGVYLSETDRFNYFPASPQVSVTSVIAGELRLISSFGDLQAARNARPIRCHCVLPPQKKPTASWSTAPIAAVTIGFSPEAWKKLGYELPNGALSDTLEEALSAFDDHIEVKSAWTSFCEVLGTRWNITRSTGGLPDWTGSDRVADWFTTLPDGWPWPVPGVASVLSNVGSGIGRDRPSSRLTFMPASKIYTGSGLEPRTLR